METALGHEIYAYFSVMKYFGIIKSVQSALKSNKVIFVQPNCK